MWARVWKTPAAAEETPRVPAPQMRREIVEVVVERINGRVADQMVDLLVHRVTEEIMAVAQGEKKEKTVEVVRLAPHEREQMVELLFSTLCGGGCRRMQNCATGAIFGQDP